MDYMQDVDWWWLICWWWWLHAGCSFVMDHYDDVDDWYDDGYMYFYVYIYIYMYICIYTYNYVANVDESGWQCMMDVAGDDGY